MDILKAANKAKVVKAKASHSSEPAASQELRYEESQDRSRNKENYGDE